MVKNGRATIDSTCIYQLAFMEIVTVLEWDIFASNGKERCETKIEIENVKQLINVPN